MEQDEGDNTISSRMRVRRNPVVLKEVAIDKNKVDKNGDYGAFKRPRIKIVHSTINWILPDHREEANLINKNVQFYKTTKIANTSKIYAKDMKIHYDPSAFLNFNTVLASHRNITDHADIDSQTFQTDKIQSKMVDSDIENLYKTVYQHKKDYSIERGQISKEDRFMFEKLAKQANNASFFNSNIPITYVRKLTRLPKNYPQTGNPCRSSNVKYIYINNYEIKTLYPSPYPEKINAQSIIHICEFCLSYCSSRFTYFRHKEKCLYSRENRPPGNEIYRDERVSIFEVDGREGKTYCRNLCLLSMLFLKSKTLYYEVEPFIFYVLYSNNGELIGYFSKEKLNSTDYNLSCILTLPIYRRLGYGFLLMELSYLLSRREFKLGTPEKPLSDLGLLTYRNYWKIKCVKTLLNLKNENIKNVTLEELGSLTGMIPTDIVFGLEELNVLYFKEDPITREKEYSVIIDDWERLLSIYNTWSKKDYWNIDETKLLWKPMIFGPSCGVNAINTNLFDTTTTSQNQNNRVDTPHPDIFKKHMALLVNFMSDDIPNNKHIELETLEKIHDRHRDNNISQPSISGEWKLCFHKPIGNTSQSNTNINRNSMRKNDERASENQVDRNLGNINGVMFSRRSEEIASDASEDDIIIRHFKPVVADDDENDEEYTDDHNANEDSNSEDEDGVEKHDISKELVDDSDENEILNTEIDTD